MFKWIFLLLILFSSCGVKENKNDNINETFSCDDLVKLFKAYKSSNSQFNQGSAFYNYLYEVGMTDFEFGVNTNFSENEFDPLGKSSDSTERSIYYKYRNPKNRTSVIINEIVVHKKENRYQPDGKILISIIFDKLTGFDNCELNIQNYAELLMENDTSIVFRLRAN